MRRRTHKRLRASVSVRGLFERVRVASALFLLVAHSLSLRVASALLPALCLLRVSECIYGRCCCECLSKEPAFDISKVQGVVIPGVTRVLVFSYLQPILGFPVIGQAIAHDQAAITDMADN